MSSEERERLKNLFHAERKSGESERVLVAEFLYDLLTDPDFAAESVREVLYELDCIQDAVASIRARIKRELNLSA